MNTFRSIEFWMKGFTFPLALEDVIHILSSIISGKIPAVILIVAHLNLMCLFFLSHFFKIFFLSCVFSRFALLLSRCCFPCIDLIWSLYSFLNQCLDAFYLIWNIFCQCFFRYCFCFPYLLITHILALHPIVSNLLLNHNWVHNFSWCIF